MSSEGPMENKAVVGLGSEDEPVYVSLVEQYEIIDEALPYPERFRTLGHLLRVNTDEATVIEVALDGDDALELAAMFARGSQRPAGWFG